MPCLLVGSDDALHFNDVHVLEAGAAAWTKPPARCAPAPCSLPPPREGHAASLIGTKLWVFGGVGRIGRSFTSLDDVVYLDVDSFTWHNPAAQMQSTNFAPAGRSLAAVLTLGSRIFYLGGLRTPKRTAIGDAAILDTETFSWSRPLPSGQSPPARFGISVRPRLLSQACRQRMRPGYSPFDQLFFGSWFAGDAAWAHHLRIWWLQQQRERQLHRRGAHPAVQVCASAGLAFAARNSCADSSSRRSINWPGLPIRVLNAWPLLGEALLMRSGIRGPRLFARAGVRLWRPRHVCARTLLLRPRLRRLSLRSGRPVSQRVFGARRMRSRPLRLCIRFHRLRLFEDCRMPAWLLKPRHLHQWTVLLQ